jgi:hypothetical protein
MQNHGDVRLCARPQDRTIAEGRSDGSAQQFDPRSLTSERRETRAAIVVDRGSYLEPPRGVVFDVRLRRLIRSHPI